MPVEWTDGGTAEVAIRRPVEPGDAIRPGGRATSGRASAAHRRDPDRAGRARHAGRGRARRRCRSGRGPGWWSSATGDELVEPGTPLAPARSGSPTASCWPRPLREAGRRGATASRRSCATTRPRVLEPDRGRSSAAPTCVITSGGVEHGREHDVGQGGAAGSSARSFARSRCSRGCRRASALSAGSGRRSSRCPGNPVSAYVRSACSCGPRCAQDARPAGGARRPPARTGSTSPVRSPAGQAVVPARRAGRGRDRSTRCAGQGSHQLAALAKANALIVVPEEVTRCPRRAVEASVGRSIRQVSVRALFAACPQRPGFPTSTTPARRAWSTCPSRRSPCATAAATGRVLLSRRGGGRAAGRRGAQGRRARRWPGSPGSGRQADARPDPAVPSDRAARR